MDFEMDQVQFNALGYARHYGLCKHYESEKPDLASLHTLSNIEVDSVFFDPADDSVANKLIELTKERLIVNKDTALFLKAVHELQRTPLKSDLTKDDRWSMATSLKQELPILRSDHELDLLRFGRETTIDFNNLKMPMEINREDNDEGFQWPEKYLQYPAQCDERVKAEKLIVSRDVLLYLQDSIRDSYTLEDAEKVMVEELKAKPKAACRPMTPPLLPLSPPMIPYVPSSPANHLPLLSESSDSVAAEAKALEAQIMAADCLTREDSGNSDLMLLDITHPPQYTLPTESRPATILKRRAEDLKVEGPLTPPMFSDSPLKKLKSVSFTIDLHEVIPDEPWARVCSQDQDCLEDLEDDDFFGQIKPLAEQAEEMVKRERLLGADTMARVDVPDIAFILPVAPWDEYSHRSGGKRRPCDTELDAQKQFLFRVKHEDLRSATSWRGVSKLERDMRWSIFTTQIDKVSLEEKLHGSTDLSKFFTEATMGPIATSSSQVWKREGLRLLDEEEEEEEIEETEYEDDRGIDALIRKRKLEMEEEGANQCKLLPPSPTKQVATHKSRHWGSAAPVPNDPAKSHPQRIIPHKRSPKALGESSNALMFGGFSATSALHKFLETRGKVPEVTVNQASNQCQSPSAHPANQILPQKNIMALPEELRETAASNILPDMPVVPDDRPPCTFIISSTFLRLRSLTKQIESLYSTAELVYRDYNLPHSPCQEADMILSPSTGLISATLQQIKQRPLPGQPDRSPVKERMKALQWRYERLVVIISEGLSQEMEKLGSSRPEDSRDKEVLKVYETLASQLGGEVVVRYIRGGPQALARSFVIEMAKYGLPHGSRDIGDIQPIAMETTWELFLRRAGLNPFAAQVIVAWLKQPFDVNVSLPSSSPGVTRPAAVSVFGLTAFMMMSEEKRIEAFQVLMGGSRILRRVSKMLDQEWVSAAHGFKL